MNQWHNKRVFVSGGAGVIGTALVDNLLKQGANLLVGDLQPLPSQWKGKLAYRHGDLITLTKAEIEKFSPEVFFHLAATFERSEETYGFWEENFHHNIHLSHHLMGLMKDSPSLKKVVFASSYLIYDPSLYLFSKPAKKAISLDESCRVAPRNLCGMAKWLHEKELAFVKHFRPDLQTISARIFRSYGKNSRDIISRWIKMIRKREEITLYRPEGWFDYTFAEDIAEGLLRLATTDYSGVVNVGSGQARQVSEVIDILRKHLGKFSCQMAEIDIPYEASEANMHLFHQITGWKGFRPLEKTIPLLIEYFNTALNLNHNL